MHIPSTLDLAGNAMLIVLPFATMPPPTRRLCAVRRMTLLVSRLSESRWILPVSWKSAVSLMEIPPPMEDTREVVVVPRFRGYGGHEQHPGSTPGHRSIRGMRGLIYNVLGEDIQIPRDRGLSHELHPRNMQGSLLVIRPSGQIGACVVPTGAHLHPFANTNPCRAVLSATSMPPLSIA